MCEILYKKDQRNPMSKVSKIDCTDFNGFNAMYVGDIGDGVCGFYATLYAEYRFMSKMSKILCIQWPLAPPGGKARYSRTVCPVGLAVHQHAVRRGSFVFKCSQFAHASHKMCQFGAFSIKCWGAN